MPGGYAGGEIDNISWNLELRAHNSTTKVWERAMVGARPGSWAAFAAVTRVPCVGCSGEQESNGVGCLGNPSPEIGGEVFCPLLGTPLWVSPGKRLRPCCCR